MIPSAVLMTFQAILFFSLAVAFILGSTWLFTNLRFYLQLKRLETGKAQRSTMEPLMLPYTIPWLGSAPAFLNEQASFWAKMRKTLGPNSETCTLRLGPVKCYIVSGAQNIQAIFKLSRHLSSDELERQIMTSVFGLPDSDVDRILQPARDDDGKVSDMGKRNRMFDIEKLYQEFLLTPHAVNCLTRKFLEVFAKSLEDASEIPSAAERPDSNSDSDPEAEWATVSFYDWLKGHMFTASTTALMGTRVLEMNPNLAQDFWVFDENFLKLVYGIPRFLTRKGHEARDHLVDGATRWLEEADSHGDIDSLEDWDPYYGSRFLREREKMDRRSGICTGSRAGVKVGLLFGISSNAIPATGWMLLHILSSRSTLLPAILSELQSCLQPSSSSSNSNSNSPAPSLQQQATLSIPHLVSPTQTPHLHSLYTETLRHYVALNLSRNVKSPCHLPGATTTGKQQQQEPDGGHLLKSGTMLMAPTWLMHRNNDVWTDPPADVFCAERFLVSENTKNNDVADGKWESKSSGNGNGTGKPIFTTAGTAGKLFPYGGGAHICPGRMFAKQEILAAVAAVLLRFEFEFVEWTGRGGKGEVGSGALRAKDGDGDIRKGFPDYKKGYVGLGIMAIEWDARVRVRRRRTSGGGGVALV